MTERFRGDPCVALRCGILRCSHLSRTEPGVTLNGQRPGTCLNASMRLAVTPVLAVLAGIAVGLNIGTPRASADPESILALGDSVMLGAQRCLEDLGIDVDAKGNRRLSSGIEVLASMGPRIPARVVVHLGTNGGLQSRELDRLMHVLGPQRQVVLLTIQLPDDPSRYSFEERTNAAIARMPHRYRNAFVLDWNRLSDKVPGLLGGDHIHLTNAGCTAYADLVDDLVRSTHD
jgi:hypothetical protein